MDKTIKQTFDINAENNNQVKLDVKLYSQDVNSAVFEFDFTNNGEALVLDESYKSDVLCIFRNTNRKVIDTINITDGKLVYKFNTGLIDSWDTIDAYIYLYKDDVKVDVSSFSFKVDKSEIDDVISELKVYYVQDLDVLKSEYKELLDDVLEEFDTKEQEALESIQLKKTNFEDFIEQSKTTISDSVTVFNSNLDQELDSGKSKIEQILSTLEGLKSDLENSNSEYKGTINSTIDDLKAYISESKAGLNTSIDSLIENGQLNIEDGVKQIDVKSESAKSEIDKLIKTAKTYISAATQDSDNAKKMAVFSMNADTSYVTTMKDQTVNTILAKPETLNPNITKAKSDISLKVTDVSNAATTAINEINKILAEVRNSAK